VQTKSAVGDHLGTTRPACGQTTRTSTGRAHGADTATDQYRRVLPRPRGQVRRAEPAPTKGEITQICEGTHQIQRIVIPAPCSTTSSHRPCQIRARCSGDRRGPTGSHGDTDRHTPTVVPTSHPRSRTIPTAWRVKDSNLGRHQPTDLQSALKFTCEPQRHRWKPRSTHNDPCMALTLASAESLRM
jgi:hypothetical protein